MIIILTIWRRVQNIICERVILAYLLVIQIGGCREVLGEYDQAKWVGTSTKMCGHLLRCTKQ